MSKSKHHKTILMVGGGSGGHIRPLLAVASEIKRQEPSFKLVYIGQKGDKYASIVDESNDIDIVKLIRAGKFRRFHNLGVRGYIKPMALLKNFRDFFYVIIGYFQSRRIIKQLKPNAVFIKGGYIGVPAGLAAARKHIPIVTHDSDAKPGLANRMIAKWVDTHAVAMPIENYDYPKRDTVYVGVPIEAKLTQHSGYLSKSNLELSDRPYLLAMGGSLGAVRLNQAISSNVEFVSSQGIDIVHITGHHDYEKYKALQTENYKVLDFTNQISDYLLNADYVVTRAGASALTEAAAVGIPMLIVPNPYLTDGHQIANADVYSTSGAALVVEEESIDQDFTKALGELLAMPETAKKQMVANQHNLVIVDSAKKIASLVLDAANRGGQSKRHVR